MWSTGGVKVSSYARNSSEKVEFVHSGWSEKSVFSVEAVAGVVESESDAVRDKFSWYCVSLKVLAVRHAVICWRTTGMKTEHVCVWKCDVQ